MAAVEYDTVVVGGGPGGYTAAIRAAQLGLSVALVEREHLGGVCLNWGCIPTKSLLHTADVLRELRGAEQLGLIAGEVDFDLAKVVARSRAVAGQLNRGVAHLMRKNGVTVYDGSARFSGQDSLAVTTADGTTEVRAGSIIIATGARARSLPGIAADGERIWTAREAMLPSVLPRRLLVIGAGAIGVEFASFYRTLGSDVTLVEVLPQILPAEDAEVAALTRQAFESQGMTIHTGTAVDSLEAAGDGLLASMNGELLEFDRAILSVGVTGNVEDLDLPSGVEVARGFIVTDGLCRTGVDGIYAVGDVAGPPCLAHKASHEGVIAAEHIAEEDPHPLSVQRIPGCTYCHPQVASVGLTEAAASESGRRVRVGRFPLLANGKAIAVGDAEGLVKTVFDADSGELLGAHMVGPQVTEMIQGFVIAMGLETTEAELAQSVFPHPTVSEAMHESVLDAWQRAINF